MRLISRDPVSGLPFRTVADHIPARCGQVDGGSPTPCEDCPGGTPETINISFSGVVTSTNCYSGGGSEYAARLEDTLFEGEFCLAQETPCSWRYFKTVLCTDTLTPVDVNAYWLDGCGSTQLCTALGDGGQHCKTLSIYFAIGDGFYFLQVDIAVGYVLFLTPGTSFTIFMAFGPITDCFPLSITATNSLTEPFDGKTDESGAYAGTEGTAEITSNSGEPAEGCGFDQDCGKGSPPTPVDQGRCIVRYKAKKDCTDPSPAWEFDGDPTPNFGRVHGELNRWWPLGAREPDESGICRKYYWRDIGPRDANGNCPELPADPDLPEEADCECEAVCPEDCSECPGADGLFVTVSGITGACATLRNVTRDLNTSEPPGFDCHWLDGFDNDITCTGTTWTLLWFGEEEGIVDPIIFTAPNTNGCPPASGWTVTDMGGCAGSPVATVST